MKRLKLLLATILSFALVYVLFVASTPMMVHAADAAALAKRINEFEHEGSGTLTATADGNTVNVIGNVSDASALLILDIDSAVTVEWRATFSGPDYPPISLHGSGVFVVAQGGQIINGGNRSTIYIDGAVSVLVNGGSVIGGTAIYSSKAEASVTVNSGIVESGGYNPAIRALGRVEINGGEVRSSNSNTVISSYYDTVVISGGTVINTGTGSAIISIGVDSSVTINGGLVVSQNKVLTISAQKLIMSGGEVRSNGEGTAIYSRTLDVTGGMVSSRSGGHAINTIGTGGISVSGGFVFANNTNVEGVVFYSYNSAVNLTVIIGEAVVCAWNQAAGRTTYNIGTSDDLDVAPAGASALWAIEGGKIGINYANGSNTGFFPIDGVTITTSGGEVLLDPTIEASEQPDQEDDPTTTELPGDDSLTGESSGNIWSKASDWAVPELQKAANLGLIPASLIGTDFTLPITRAEFAAVSVKVHESLSGQATTPASPNPFTDTSDAEVLKAFNVGITAGTSATTFEPNLLLDREQAATMLARVYKRTAFDGWTLATDADFPLPYTRQAPFADDADISDWARDSVYFMVSKRIINGIGNNLFAPRNTTAAEEALYYANATREQALLISTRMVENLN